MNKLKTGLLYLSLHNQLKKKVGEGRLISRKMFFEILGKHFLIPKNLRIVMIYEMGEIGLIKVEDKDYLKVCKCEWDLERDVNKFYKDIGLF